MEDNDNIRRSFVAQLVGDVIAAEARLTSDETQRARRDIVRTRYAAIEGLVWMMREHVHSAMQAMGYLTPLADLALRERSYIVTDAGELKEQVRFTPLRQAVRLIVSQARLLGPDLDISYAEPGWQALQEAMLIRNRVTHPKSLQDMAISSGDVEHLRRAMTWILATSESVMARTNQASAEFNEQTRALLADLQRGDSEALAAYYTMLNRDLVG